MTVLEAIRAGNHIPGDICRATNLDVRTVLARLAVLGAEGLVRADHSQFSRYYLQEEEPVGERCTAMIHHGSGHQSSTRCRWRGPHEEHEAIYGSDQQVAYWRDGQYQRQLEDAGIPREEWPKWVNEGTAMTGFFDEPPRESHD